MQSKTFRLFVSSTFSDFNEERKLLQTEVFPEIKEYCTENGLTFQPIDLRWGVSNEAQLDQKTLELCINEVKSSKLNPHPNFLIMAGDRYGWVPLPYMLEQKEFENILEKIENDKDKTLLQTWYELDLNQIPASYILKQRSGEYEDYKTWEEVENSLRTILQNSVDKLDLNKEDKKKYFTSATEAEVIEGIFKYLDKTKFQNKLCKNDETLEQKDYENVYAYVRNIDSIDNLEGKFKDIDSTEVTRFKDEIKKSIDTKNIYEITTNLTNVSQDEKNNSLNYEYEELKSSFTKTMVDYLKNSIDKYLENIIEVTPEELESYEQKRFKDDKLKDFLKDSRSKDLKTIDDYIQSNKEENQSLVIYGKSGLGKSSLMAKAIDDCLDKYQDRKVIYRFVGSTANLSSSPDLLISILKELGINEEIRKVKNSQTFQEEPEKIEEFYYRVYEHLNSISNETVIFIDAIDQVNNEDEFLWLSKVLPSNVKFIIAALEDENYEEDSNYFENFKKKTESLYKLEELRENEAKSLVLNLLNQYDRTITDTQMNYLLNIYKQVNTPLYISVAVQEIRHWKSSDINQTLANTQKSIIEEFISNLSTIYHHNKELIKRVFSYLYLTEGLSESELLELLSIDEEFINKIAPDTYHDNITKELPTVIWVRLHTQIKEFLKLEQKDKQATMSFFHREFNNVISNQDNIQIIHEHLIYLFQKLITKYQNEEFDSNRWGKLYIKIVKDYHLEYEFDWLIEKNSKLKETGDFVGNLNNKDYQLEIWNKIYDLIIQNQKINNSKLQNCLTKFNLYITEIPYKKDPNNSIQIQIYTRSLNNLGISLGTIGKSIDAISLFEKSFKILKKEYNKNLSKWGQEYSSVINYLAQSFSSLGNFNESIKLNKESLKIRKELYILDEKKFAKNYIESLNNLASVLIQNIEFKEANELLKESLTIVKKFYFENPLDWLETYIIILQNLGVVNHSKGEILDSIKYCEESLNFLKDLYKENSSQWAAQYVKTLNSIGYYLSKIEKISDSMNYCNKCKKILDKLYLENPLRWLEDYLSNLDNLASNYYKIKNIDKTIEHYQKYLEVSKSSPKNNIKLWTLTYTKRLDTLAYIFNSIGRTSESITLSEESLKTWEKLYKIENSWIDNYASSLQKFAIYLKINGDIDKSIKSYQKAVTLRRKKYKSAFWYKPENFAQCLFEFAETLKDNGDIYESIGIYEECLLVSNKIYEKNSKKWAEEHSVILDNLASLLLINTERRLESLELFDRFIEVKNKLYKINPEKFMMEYLTSLNNLGSVLLGYKEFEYSYKYFKEYFTILNVYKIIKTKKNLDLFTYSFLKYYQSAIHTESNLTKLEDYIKEKIIFFKENLELEYDNHIKIVCDKILNLKNTNDDLIRERVEIFEKLFLVNPSLIIEEKDILMKENPVPIYLKKVTEFLSREHYSYEIETLFDKLIEYKKSGINLSYEEINRLNLNDRLTYFLNLKIYDEEVVDILFKLYYEILENNQYKQAENIIEFIDKNSSKFWSSSRQTLLDHIEKATKYTYNYKNENCLKLIKNLILNMYPDYDPRIETLLLKTLKKFDNDFIFIKNAIEKFDDFNNELYIFYAFNYLTYCKDYVEDEDEIIKNIQNKLLRIENKEFDLYKNNLINLIELRRSIPKPSISSTYTSPKPSSVVDIVEKKRKLEEYEMISERKLNEKRKKKLLQEIEYEKNEFFKSSAQENKIKYLELQYKIEYETSSLTLEEIKSNDIYHIYKYFNYTDERYEYCFLKSLIKDINTPHSEIMKESIENHYEKILDSFLEHFSKIMFYHLHDLELNLTAIVEFFKLIDNGKLKVFKYKYESNEIERLFNSIREQKFHEIIILKNKYIWNNKYFKKYFINDTVLQVLEYVDLVEKSLSKEIDFKEFKPIFLNYLEKFQIKLNLHERFTFENEVLKKSILSLIQNDINNAFIFLESNNIGNFKNIFIEFIFKYIRENMDFEDYNLSELEKRIQSKELDNSTKDDFLKFVEKINLKNQEKITVELFLAASEKNYKLVSEKLKLLTNKDVVNDEGKTLLDLAIEMSYEEYKDDFITLENDKKQDESYEKLYNRGRFGEKLDYGKTLKINFNFTDILLKEGLSINHADKHGNNYLHKIIDRSWRKLSSREILTPVPTYEWDEEFFTFFLNNNINIEHKNNKGETPLLKALIESRFNLVNILLDKNACIDIKNNEGITPFYLIVKNDQHNIAKKLIEKGMNFLEETYQDKSLIFLAIENGSYFIIDHFVEKIDLDKSDKEGRKPIHYATMFKDISILKLLIENKVNINAQDNKGVTPLHYAVKYKNLDMLKVLIKNNVNLNLQDQNNKTPLHYAVHEKDIDAVKVLVENNVNKEILDINGKTALDYAKVDNFDEAIKLLRKKFLGLF
ncbi:ankyrin repeat domain-containing protein [Arcobacter arenosus]|uniref:DUF4062 domain-containing protein n=1 Tax=Arcobacter arenosus TaxID=2576037 RepID=A0A5R8XXM4_9BACT|nr:ankyrin repeat domain-containing protein [Arcobacter arenosus]TLP35500.1 DUF4062 domain-containing protein [Arcobacter arenosus]